jgi:transposase
MDNPSSTLPEDPNGLRERVLALATERDRAYEALKAKTLEVEKLKLQLAKLRRLQFGRASEKLSHETDQLALAIEEIAADLGALAEATVEADTAPAEPSPPSSAAPRKPARQKLPVHLPRETIVHAPAATCPDCGGATRLLGEDHCEILEYVPGHFKVIEHVRPKVSCRACETIRQAPPPAQAIERGRPGPGLLAHVLVAKYGDHLPLYRQAEIYARDGVELSRSTLAGWVGRAAFELAPLVEAVEAHVLAGAHVHGDDTPVPVLAPGNGKTTTGRLWAYVRDERPWASEEPPAVFYRYSPDRKAIHPQSHLAAFRGSLQADGYAGFGELYRSGKVREVACWAHVRRKFFDIHAANGSPLAKEALDRIGELYAVEAAASGQPPDRRRDIRRSRAGPRLDAFKVWLDATLTRVSGKSELAGAIRYATSRWPQLTRYGDDGRLAIDNNAAERSIRAIALGRKNWLFAGSDAGGERAGALYTLLETAKLNGIDPEAWLRDVLARLATHPASRIADLLPWRWAPARLESALAA